jgi:hypothetical protein
LTPEQASHESKSGYFYNKARTRDPHLPILLSPPDIFIDKRCDRTEKSPGSLLKDKVQSNYRSTFDYLSAGKIQAINKTEKKIDIVFHT